MDGSLGDRVTQDRLFRPVTLTYAVNNYPRLIYRLKQRRLKIFKTTIISGKRFFRIRDSINKHEAWDVLEEDFNRCKSIVEEVEIRTFPSDTQEIVEKRIEALVRVSFSDRPF